jgi:hypothetical protein
MFCASPVRLFYSVTAYAAIIDVIPDLFRFLDSGKNKVLKHHTFILHFC